ncbi:MAG TPA: mucoidy inhibitor MuiA family protein, partial [Kofleriaceae bacterium]|nr:mucoidy inhibitor MuiA family protein [Kofleriaceae bacterium]
MQVESRITEVTLYARGARVRRTASVALTGPRVRITGLPVAALDDTVRVEVEGGAVVTAVHVGLDAPAPEAAAEEVAAELRDARRRAALADAEVERLDAAIAALAAAPIAVSEPAAPRDEPPPAWGAIVEARRALVALRAERELALRDQAAAARRAAAEAHRALAAAQDRERRGGTARPARLHELRKHIDLQVEGSGSATLHLEYQVAAARWAPSYVARLDGDRAMLEVRAAVAQATGEDWTAVRLRLSTAEPEQFGALPELAAQRIGRRQPEPGRSGFRAPPAGVAALYDDYRRAFPEPNDARVVPAKKVSDARSGGGGKLPPAEVAASPGPPAFAASPGPPAFAPPPSALAFAPPPSAPAGRAGPPPAPAAGSPMKSRVTALAAPQAMRARVALPEPAATLLAAGGGDGVMAAPSPGDRVLMVPPPPPPPPRLDYTNLVMAPPGSPERGALIAASDGPGIAALTSPPAGLGALPLPPGCSASWPHTYDYAFATDGAVDVRSDGAWHSIAVTARPATAKLRHVAVPREQTDVFRLASIGNPL